MIALIDKIFCFASCSTFHLFNCVWTWFNKFLVVKPFDLKTKTAKIDEQAIGNVKGFQVIYGLGFMHIFNFLSAFNSITTQASTFF